MENVTLTSWIAVSIGFLHALEPGHGRIRTIIALFSHNLYYVFFYPYKVDKIADINLLKNAWKKVDYLKNRFFFDEKSWNENLN